MVKEIENIDISQLIKTKLDKEKSKLPANTLPLLEEALNKVLVEGLSIKEALNIPQMMIDGYYENGYYLFKSGKFKEAIKVFQFLSFFDALDRRYVLAIATTFHQMKSYVDAAGYYLEYAALDPTNPMPYYYLYDCFTKMNHPLLAYNALKKAQQIAGENPEYAQLKNKLDLEIVNLQIMHKGSKEKENQTNV